MVYKTKFTLFKKLTNISKQNAIFIKDINGPTDFTAVETYVAENLALKFGFTVKIQLSLIDAVGICK
jgi:hypothetical protein